MIKRIQDDYLFDNTQYNKIIDYLEKLEGKYVVLLKNFTIELNDANYHLEKGSLVQLHCINIKNLTEDKDKQDAYIDKITISILDEDDDVSNIIMWTPKNKINTEEDCINNIKEACAYLSENFGTTEQTDLISKKLVKYTSDNRLANITLIIHFICLPFIIYSIFLIGKPDTNVLQMIIFVIGILSTIFFMYNWLLFNEILESIIITIDSNKRIKYWTYYDKLITEYAKTSDIQQLNCFN